MPPKKESVWSIETELKLIELVKIRPLLWDQSSALFRRCDLKEKEWENITLALGPGFTCESVKKRWGNIRGTYNDNHNKVANSLRSGMGSENVYSPRWPLYSQCQSFLESTTRVAESTSNLASPITSVSSPASPITSVSNPASPAISQNLSLATSLTPLQIEIPTGNVYFDENVQAFIDLPEDDTNSERQQQGTSSMNIVSEPSPSTSSGVESFSPSPPPQRPVSAPTVGKDLFKPRGVKRPNNSSVVHEALGVIKKIAEDPVVPPTKDRTDHFCAYVASVLRELPAHDRMSCEMQIMDVLRSFNQK